MGLIGSIREAFDDGVDKLDAIADDIMDYGISDLSADIISVFTPDIPTVDTTSATSAINVTQRGADAQIPVIYGRRATGGQLVAPPFISGVNSEYMSLVLTLCEGEIDAIESIYINDILSTDAQFASLVTIETVMGTSGQAAFAGLISAAPTLWTSDHKLSGLAAVHIKIKRDKEIFKSYPRLKFIVRGKKCFDPRTSTTIYTTNPIIHALDYLTNTTYGKGEPVSDYTTWIAAANACDVTMQESSNAVFIKRFENNSVVDTSRSVKENLALILSACRGEIKKDAVQFSVFIEGAGASVFAFSESNIIGGMRVDLGDKSTKLNKASAHYINPVTFEADLKVYSSSTLKTLDDGYELSDDINLAGETNQYRALDFAETIIKQSRDSMRANFTAGIAALAVEVGDIVSVSYASYGFTSKLFRVKEKSFNANNGLIQLSCAEHFDSFYNRAIPPEAATPLDTNLPNAASKLAAPSGVVVSTGDSIFSAYDTAGILVSWSASTEFFASGYELIYTVDGVAVSVRATDRTSYLITPVALGKQYKIELCTLNAFGSRGYFSTAYIVAQGESAPAAPTSLSIASGDAQLLMQANGTILTRAQLTWAATNPRSGFEVQYKKTSVSAWSSIADMIDENLRTAFIVALDEQVSYDFRVRATNKTVSSAWATATHTVQGKTAPPPQMTTFLVSVMSDGTRVFDGTYTNKPIDFRGYRIKYSTGTGGTWGSMTNLTTDLVYSLPFETNSLPAGAYTIAIKPVDTSGIEATNAVYIESNLPDPREGEVLYLKNEHEAGYQGTKTSCSVQQDGSLQSNDLGSMTWDNAADWATRTRWIDNPALTIVYDVPVIDNGARTSFVPYISYSGSTGTFTVTEAHSDDGTTYTSYAAAGGVITARYLKIKISITHTSNCVLKNLIIRLGANLKDETHGDLDTSTLTPEGGGGVRLPINSAYAIIKNVYITVQGSAANITWSLIDKNPTSGPQIIFKNSGGTTVYPVIDYRIEGL